ncbi:putative DNA primase small subunit [Podospora australis]|uniref:DNA primase n=1 Tax=Podospora australis TaxID=1536484 RepID=A0AAN6X1J9_9PEZI|nr:putative DNA primase small subunit [Podospora australis]
MPHSVTPPSESATPIAMDQDAPAPMPENGQSPEQDIVMADADVPVEVPVSAPVPTSSDTPPPVKVQETEPSEEIPQGKRGEIKLEDLFEGMDSDEDEEFPSGVKGDILTSQVPPSSQSPITHKESTSELLPIFYQRFFPWRHYFYWLNHSPTPTNDFKHREFSLWLQNEVVMRFRSYPTLDLFRKEVLHLMPNRIEIGPIYTANPRDRKTFRNSSAFRPVAKELCFDIDLTDYDDVRTCCDKANICVKCWQFITMAIKVLDTALREDFGYEHILWVYSGRRGAHAWVCDRRARQLDDHKRKALASYFVVLKGGKEAGKRVNLRRPLHPHLARSLDILKDHFQKDILETQDPWREPERSAYLLSLLPDADLREALRKKWENQPSRNSSQKWADIDALAKTSASSSMSPKDLLEAKQDIVLEYTYPRLDVVVTQQLTHLLKSPFVIHPGTGRVCVPIDTDRLEDFDPADVPTIGGLVREVDSWSAEHHYPVKREDEDGEAKGKELQDWEKTSLKPYIDLFRGFVSGVVKEERDAVRIKREREENEGEGIDF